MKQEVTDDFWELLDVMRDSDDVHPVVWLIPNGSKEWLCSINIEDIVDGKDVQTS